MANAKTKPKYSYNDLYVFCRMFSGLYISLSDFEFGYNAEKQFKNETSKYLIAVQGKEGYWISDVSLEDLMQIAGITQNTNFVKQCRNGVEPDFADDLLATICAKKILNSTSGEVYLEEDCPTLTYTFVKRKIINNKRHNAVVHRKTFRKGQE